MRSVRVRANHTLIQQRRVICRLGRTNVKLNSSIMIGAVGFRSALPNLQITLTSLQKAASWRSQIAVLLILGA